MSGLSKKNPFWLLPTPPTKTWIVSPLLFSPEKEGTIAVTAVSLQLPICAVTPLNLTVLVPCVPPNPLPLMVTKFPENPCVGLVLVMFGTAKDAQAVRNKKAMTAKVRCIHDIRTLMELNDYLTDGPNTHRR